MKNKRRNKIIPFKKKNRKEIQVVKVSEILKKQMEKNGEKISE